MLTYCTYGTHSQRIGKNIYTGTATAQLHAGEYVVAKLKLKKY